jgi:hypothetical protein
MQKRALRVVEWLGQAPAVAACTHCERTFRVPIDTLKRPLESQWNLDKKFAEHKCKLLNFSQNALRIVQEATDE